MATELKLDPKRVEGAKALAKEAIQKSSGTTFRIRNALDELERLTPSAQHQFASGGVIAKQNEPLIRKAVHELLDAILDN